jgi:hypothetical protein
MKLFNCRFWSLPIAAVHPLRVEWFRTLVTPACNRHLTHENSSPCGHYMKYAWLWLPSAMLKHPFCLYASFKMWKKTFCASLPTERIRKTNLLYLSGLRPAICIRGCVQKFPDWPPGARTANGTADTICSCIAILWVSLVSFAAITLCVASRRVFIVVVIYFVTASYPMGTRVSFPGGKAAGAWSWPLTSN